MSPKGRPFSVLELCNVGLLPDEYRIGMASVATLAVARLVSRIEYTKVTKSALRQVLQKCLVQAHKDLRGGVQSLRRRAKQTARRRHEQCRRHPFAANVA